MKVRFYGVRGSVPTPGSSTVRYGGNTVCTDVRLADGTLLVLDAGTGLRELGHTLAKEGHDERINVLLTHLHWDHILGLPFFGPLWKKETSIDIWPLANEAQRLAASRRTLFDGIHFPVRAADVPARVSFLEDDALVWKIGSARITRILLNHPGGAQGYRIDDEDGSSLAYITDNELAPPGPIETSTDALARFTQGVDLLVHDAQYLAEDMPAKRGWGHSTVDDVLDLGLRAGAKHLVLFHHEPERDDDALDVLGALAEAFFRERASTTRVSVAREGTALAL
jgi:phosphoribosyl 1,2-cyclic phosphodiesterase